MSPTTQKYLLIVAVVAAIYFGYQNMQLKEEVKLLKPAA